MMVLTALTVILVVFGTARPDTLKWKEASEQTKESAFSFASYYGDHMVLQQSPKRATVWGYADMADLGGQVKIEVKDTSGKYGTAYYVPVMKGPFPDKAVWSVTLEPMGNKGSYSIMASLNQQTIMLQDVLFGDVWLCSGQSNMVFTVIMMMNASQELADLPKYQGVRVFTVDLKTSTVPLYDLPGVEERWSLPTNDTIGHKAWSYFSAVCWLYGRHLYQTLGYPIGLITSAWGGTPVEAWMSPQALASCGIKPGHSNQVPSLVGPNDHSVLWNAMIHPLMNMTVYGSIWYQGEANSGSPNTYNCTFPAMIDDWRQKFNMASSGQTDPVFPFGFVQLAANRNNMSITTGFPDIRWHQTADTGYVPNFRMKNVFMAVAMDLPDFNSPYGSIHPEDKLTVGSRLALSGLSVAYGKSYKFQGPMPSAFFIDIGFYTLRIEMDEDHTAIEVRNKDGYEVCCSPSNITDCESGTVAKWAASPIINSTQNSVTLDWSQCKNMYIMGLRYAWRESPCPYKKCAVYAVENELPAPPFIMSGIFGPAKGRGVFRRHGLRRA